MKESEPIAGDKIISLWMDFFVHPLCVGNCKKGAVSAFCPVLWNASVCILYADGLFLPGMRWNRSLRALLSGKIFVCAVDFPMIFMQQSYLPGL